MTTLRTLRHLADGTVIEGTIEVEPVVRPPRRRPAPPIPGAVFLARVANDEYKAVLDAAAAQMAAGEPRLQRWLDLLRLNGEVQSESDDAKSAKALLVAGGLLTQERADAIFAPMLAR